VLHLRVISPTARTGEVVELLDGHIGVAHLVVARGSAVRPPGDTVDADIARECADEILTALAGMDIDHDGAITLQALETTLSDAVDRAKLSAPGGSDEAVVWDELLARASHDARLNWMFLTFLTLGLMISVVGVVTDSPVTVIGAMAVAPDFGPVAALAVGLVGRRWDLVRRSLLTTVAGFGCAAVVTAGFVMALEATGLMTVEAPGLDGSSQVDFIYQVGPFSLIVAMLAGAAGMLSLLSAKSTALVGVFISVTTVAAAAYALVAAVLGDWSRSAQSVQQLGVNLAGIIVAATLVLAIRARKHRRADDAERPLSRG
jgi:uncharacterized hydrophobic protein (TIGR00271 family)